MNITFIGHASILIETQGLKILSDPWWRGPCFGAQWWNYPLPATAAVDTQGIDYIYISHGHHDHYHPGTLRSFSRRTRVLVSARIGLAESIRAHGFEVIEVRDEEVRELGHGVTCRIWETHAQDTLMVVDDGQETCVNLNDALHATPHSVQDHFIHKLRQTLPRLDYVFCGYGVASHFPNCYRLPGKAGPATAARRQHHFNRQWCRVVAALAPRFGFPFAADVAFLEQDLQWVNEPTQNSERPTDLFRREHPGVATQVVDIAPGFRIGHGAVLEAITRQPLALPRLLADCAEGVVRANRYGSVSAQEVAGLRTLLANNIARCADFLQGHAGDYRFGIAFRNSPQGLLIEKRGRDIQVREIQDMAEQNARCDVTYLTRAPYLRLSLTARYGHEILFVGSGGIFTYLDRHAARQNLHRELMRMMTHAVPGEASWRPARGPWVAFKRGIKRLLGRAEPDLYDIDAWTVYS